ncbi:ABC transporter ATP-binding protein [Gordonia hydrophobica]|uniref:ABC transporter ATP-binding protein n=1 Tax=Gordonia hydrophobica TaxID=40516 RepID=A0ABZ2U0L8_9ACTN|nr:ABC transporter ATP-binding protein [Gordonia hydrophobica]MBM7367777.1 ATP-binding cassette subfamily B protein [Gordonia hydrophobica]
MTILHAVREVRAFLGSDRRLSVALVLALIAAATSVVIPLLLARITDLIFAGVVGSQLADGATDLENIADRLGAVPGVGVDWPRLWAAAGAVGIALIVLTSTRIGGGLLVNNAVQAAIRRIRERVEAKVHRVPVGALEGKRRGEVLNAMTVDIDNFSSVIGPIFVQLPVLILTIVAVVVALIAISPFFAMIVFATIPITTILAVVVLRLAKPHMERQWQTTAAITAHVEDVYSARDMVSAYNGTQQTAREFDALNSRLQKAGQTGQTWSATLAPVLTFLNAIVFVVIAVLGALRMLDGSVTLGVLQAVLLYAQQLSSPISELTSTLPRLQSGFISFGRVRAFLAEPEESGPAVDDPVSPPPSRHRLPPHIVFSDVHFAYDATPVLRGVNLELAPGRTTALVGATGSGKTTLTSLLQRFVEPSSGTITLDGENIADLTRGQIRAQLAVVTQDPWLFTGSAGENIDYGTKDGRVPDEWMIDLLLAGLPSGRDTVVSGDNDVISAGEKQLLTVARALAGDPDILILDEATSAADPRTELVISRGLEALRHRTTTLIVTHRYSTLATADSVAVLADGRIIEHGTAEELLAAGGEFARLYG